MNKEVYQLFRSWFLSRYLFVCDDVLNWIFCQSWLETGNFKSKIFEQNANLFGMKLARVRLTTAHGANRGHALYTNCIESIDDYMYWCCYNGFVQSDFLDIVLFVNKLKKTSYNPHMDTYINSINQLYSKNFVK